MCTGTTFERSVRIRNGGAGGVGGEGGSKRTGEKTSPPPQARLRPKSLTTTTDADRTTIRYSAEIAGYVMFLILRCEIRYNIVFSDL